MSQIYKFLGTVLVALFITTTLHAAQDDTKKLFISVTSGDFKQSGMAMGIANAMQEAGVKTTVFLGANSVKYAMRKGKQEAFGPTGKSVKEMMSTLVKKGGTVMVCGMCAKYMEVKPSDLVDGIKIISGKEVYGRLFAAYTQTLSF